MQTLDIAKVNKSKKLLGLRNKKGEHISSKNTIPIIKSARKRQFSLLVNDEVEQVVITGTEAEKKRFKRKRRKSSKKVKGKPLEPTSDNLSRRVHKNSSAAMMEIKNDSALYIRENDDLNETSMSSTRAQRKG